MAFTSASTNWASPTQVDVGNDLVGAIRNIKAPGSFAGFGKLREGPPAGLLVRGVGVIKIPLDNNQASELIANARQAPYGKGSETLVDTAVRNTWEIDADQLAFPNPHWNLFVENICYRVTEDLGIDGRIRADIYKMLIYEKGAMFKPHTDTEKIPGMFGTLIVCLPSAHKGGDVVVKHCSERKTFKTSQYSLSYACWYSDVSHEVRPVTSGHRLVLTYNLAHNVSQPRPTPGLQDSDMQSIHQILSRWLGADPALRKNSCMFQMLDHDYTQGNISLQALKSHDFTRAQAIGRMRSQLPFEVFLVLLEMEMTGECEEEGSHYIDEVTETEYKVHTLVDYDGNEISENLIVKETDILEPWIFDDLMEPFESEHGGYMGNWGPTATLRYRMAAMALVPHDSLDSFLEN